MSLEICQKKSLAFKYDDKAQEFLSEKITLTNPSNNLVLFKVNMMKNALQ